MSQPRNAWIVATKPEHAPMPTPPVEPKIPLVTGAAKPQKGVPEPDAADRLPRRPVSGRASLWVVGVHGGAGESFVSNLFDDSRPTQHTWPVVDAADTPVRVLLICRSNRSGLEAARKALIEWTSPHPPAVELLGLAVAADAPGKLPKSLRDLATIVGGGAPRLWHLPWVEEWRTGEVDRSRLPREIRRFMSDINALLPSSR